MSILDDAVTLSLPYTNSKICYDRLDLFPPIKQAFYQSIVPIATSQGDLSTRLSDMEQERQKALDDYLEAGNSLREVDTTLNCCMADLYIALFDGLGFKISESQIAQSDKLDFIKQMRALLANILDWNPTKRTELDMLLQGTSAEIELDS